MKSLWIIALLLSITGVLFPISGKVFTKLIPTWQFRPNDATSYVSNQSALSLRDTGIFLNFDFLTAEYRMDLTTNDIPNPMDGPRLGLLVPPDTYRPVEPVPIPLTGPGWFDFGCKPSSNFKLNLGGRWFTLNESKTDLLTNTNSNYQWSDMSITYNFVGIEPRLEYRLNDQISLKADRLVFEIYGGKGKYNYVVTNSATNFMTNSYESSGFNWKVPLLFSYSGSPLGLDLMVGVSGISSKAQDISIYSSGISTNNTAINVFVYESYIKGYWSFAPGFSLNAKVALLGESSQVRSDNSSMITNITNYNRVLIGPSIELAYSPVPNLTLKLGAGSWLTLTQMEQDLSYFGDVASTNYAQSVWPGPLAWSPLIEFGGDFDITDNFTIGIFGKLIWTSYYWDKQVATGQGGTYTTRSMPLVFSTDSTMGVGFTCKF